MIFSVVTKTGYVVVDGEDAQVDLSKVKSELLDGRTFAIHWNGQDGVIERTSRVAGKVDFEHFDDVSLLQPFVAAFEARKAEIAAEAAKAEAERLALEEKRKAEVADLDRRSAEAAKAQAPTG
jgi:hypothetical protein